MLWLLLVLALIFLIVGFGAGIHFLFIVALVAFVLWLLSVLLSARR